MQPTKNAKNKGNILMKPKSYHLICTISKIYKEICNLYAESLTSLNLSLTEALIITNLSLNNCIYPSELVEKLFLDKSTISRFLDKLELKKLIHRCKCGKKIKITLTNEGEQIKKEIIKIWDELSTYIDDISDNPELMIQQLDNLYTKILNRKGL